MNGSKHTHLGAQRGVSLSGLIFVLAIIAVIALFALKVFPTFIEFRAIKSSIAAAKTAGGTVRDMQVTFDKNADINAIDAIKGRDLIIVKSGDSAEIAFDYEKKIQLFEKVFLLINYSGTTDPKGIIHEKVEQPQ